MSTQVTCTALLKLIGHSEAYQEPRGWAMTGAYRSMIGR